MSKILYILPLITLAWTVVSILVCLPLWMLFTRRNRRYHRANNWADDFQFDAVPHSGVERAGMADVSPESCHAGAIHSVTL